MILFNGKAVNPTKFPDGTSSFRFDVYGLECPGIPTIDTIEWKYDGDHECIIVWYLVKQIRSILGPAIPIQLMLPYVPNARMDRVKSSDEVFTLKWFADFINSMNFCNVAVLDPHSNVAAALINNVYVMWPDDYIRSVRVLLEEEYGCHDPLMCYPDEGAAKRYSELMKAEYIFGIKHRDWRSGKIEGLELTTPEKVSGRDVLIVDDICSRGGTFTHTARALKEAGANDIYLYVSHCENTIFKGSVLTDGLIRHVFTTDSIYRGEHENITVIGGKE